MPNNIVYRTSTDPAVNASGGQAAGGLTNVQLDGNFKSLSLEVDLRAPIANPTFTGSVTLPSSSPVNDYHAASKLYVDLLAGIDFHADCVIATTANITLSGLQTIDGRTLTAGERVLVKNQSTASQNGIYVAASGAWTRASDADASRELKNGSYVFVQGGPNSAQRNTGWILTTPGEIVPGTTAQTWQRFVAPQLYTAGTGLTVNNNEFVISTVPVVNGGTGLTSYATGDILYATGSASLGKLAAGGTGNVLLSGTNPSWGKVGLTSHISGTLAVGNGGTGVSTLSGIVFGNGTSAFSAATGAQISAALGTTYVENANYASAANTANSASNAGNSTTTTQRTFSNIRTDGINRGSYGSISITNSLNGYGGIDLTDQSVTWMTNIVGGVSFGAYKNNSTWAFYFNADGRLSTGTVPWESVVEKPTTSTWNSVTSMSVVVGQLAWKNYGNNHVIFDASAGTSPSGAVINNTNPSTYWNSSYPTLMGWNGSSTYGVRVDTARYAESVGVTTTASNANYFLAFVGSQSNGAQAVYVDSSAGSYNPSTNLATINITGNAGYATSAGNAGTVATLEVASGRNNQPNQIVRTNGSGYLDVGYVNSNSGNEANNSSPPRVWGTNGTDDYMRTYLTSALSVGYASSAGNADTVDSQSFSYSNDSNAPTYVWATNSNGSSFLAARASMSVNYATSASYASSVTISETTSATAFKLLFTDSGAGNKSEYTRTGTGAGEYNPSTNTATINISGNSAYATNAGNADTVDDQSFSYSNSSDSPTYLWATNSNGSSFLAARANMSVNYASTAGSVAWTNVTSRPTALSSFTNDSGYITSSASISGNAASASTIGGTATTFGLSNSATNTGAGSKAGPEVTGQGGGGAVWSMHRPGSYGLNMGLDSDNVFRIGGWSASANRLQMDMSGNLTMAGNVTAYSDEKLKTDWEELPSNFIKSLAETKTGTYTRVDSGERQVGVSAQSLQNILPEAVIGGEYLSVSYGNAALAAAVMLARKVEELEARLAALESK